MGDHAVSGPLGPDEKESSWRSMTTASREKARPTCPVTRTAERTPVPTAAPMVAPAAAPRASRTAAPRASPASRTVARTVAPTPTAVPTAVLTAEPDATRRAGHSPRPALHRVLPLDVDSFAADYWGQQA